MDSTAERLTVALDAAAETVSPDRVRPLREAQPGRTAGRRTGTRKGTRTGLRAGTRTERARWSTRLAPVIAPVGAAVAVLLVVAVALVATSGNHPAASVAKVVPASSAGGAPKYYAEVEGKMYGWHGHDSVQVVVRSTATGAVVARIPNPAIANTPEEIPISVAAAPGDRTFYAIYRSYDNTKLGYLWVYRFRLTASGGATAPVAVNGGLITGQNSFDNVGGFVVSPDGSRLAVAVSATGAPTSAGTVAGQILVIDLRTGAHAVWRGGLDEPGLVFGIQGLSWTGDGKSLVYLGQWCAPKYISYGIYGGFGCSTLGSGQSPPQAEGATVVRKVAVTAAGGALTSGPVLLRPADPAGALPVLVTPDGKSLITIASSTSGFQVVRISIATGKVTSVLGPVPGSGPSAFLGTDYLAADGTGDYVLIWQAGSSGQPTHGWVHGGTYHQLAPTFADHKANSDAWIQMTW
jgi:hypothetical protein